MVLYVNNNWGEFARKMGKNPETCSEGANYLEICEGAAETNSAESPSTARGIRDVIQGKKKFFELEYPYQGHDAKHWFSMKVIPLSGQFPTPVMVQHLDITEKKLIEINQHAFSDIVEQSGDSIIYTDKDFRIKFINRATEELFGWSLKELKDKTPEILNAEAESLKIQDKIYSTVSAGNTFYGEALNKRKDGSTFFCQFKVSPLFYEGNIYGYASSQRDISKGKQAEEALRDSEERFRSLFYQSGEGAFLVDLEGRILEVNKKVLEMFGYSREELLKRLIPEILSPENIHEGQMYLKKTMEEGSTSFEVELVKKSGESFTGEIFSSVVTIEGKPLIQGTIKDITEREKAKKAQMESEARYHSFVQNFHGIAYRGGMDFSAEFIHGKVEEITGFTEEDLTAGTPRWDQLIHPEDLARIHDVGKIMATVPGYSTEREYRIVQKDGQVRWIREFVHNICSEEGKPSHVQGTIYDITERKQDKEKIKHLNSVLQAVRGVNRLITKETDRNQLLQGICDKLIETRGFYNTWIALFDENQKISRVYKAGWGKEFLSFENELKSGKIPHKIQNIFNLPQTVAIKKPSGCYDCSLSNYHRGQGSFAARLEYDGKVYGILSASVPANYIGDKEEMEMFQEVAEDIAFALNDIDIKEKKACAEEELRQNHEIFQKTFESAPMLMSLSSAEDGTYFDVNKKYLEVSGFTREDVIGKKSTELQWISEEDRALLASTLREQGKVEGLELTLYNKDGKEITCLYYGELLTINGKQQLLSLARDITERKQIENELKESEERYRTLLEYSPMALLVLKNGKYTFVNPEGCRMLGYSSPEEVKKINAIDLFLPEDRMTMLERMKNIADGKKNKPEIMRIRRKDGSITHTESMSVPIILGGETATLIVGKDITESKRAEEEMKQLAQRLKLATESARIGVWELDIHKNILVWDEKMYGLYGIHPEDFGGKYETWQERIHPEDLPKASKEVMDAIDDKKEFHTEFRIIKPDGEVRNVEAHAVVLGFSENDPKKMIGVNLDITERKNGEKALLEAKLAAEKANRTKDEFLASVSHELRTPLNSIIGYSSLLLEVEKGNLSIKQERYVENVLKSGKHLLGIINDILDVSKIEAGKMELSYCFFLVSDVINEVVNLILPMASEKNIDFEIYIRPQNLRIFADMVRFKQIMHNLLSNAVKFTHDSGHISILAELLENEVHVSVSDTGIGISEENQKELFEPFKQVDPFTSRKYEGTGLGLALVKELVNLHGGSVGVKSELGKGSTFRFCLPSKVKIRGQLIK